MKIYRTKSGIVLEFEDRFWELANEEWDSFINDDSLSEKIQSIIRTTSPVDEDSARLLSDVQAPIRSQELWGAGVTYIRSKVGRQEESVKAGGGDFYARVYEAERPELFFKANAHRIVGHGQSVRIRKDSAWSVPEPELTLVVTSGGKVVGYTIGNDMSSRSIEGENPLYLPQAKTYDGCAALGPCIYVSDEPLPPGTAVTLEITRAGSKAFSGSVEIGQMKRTTESLVSVLYRECSFPHGSLLMTGTGIVPPREFSLRSGDRIRITIGEIGMLENSVT